ncbi:MAG: hypothetical protein CL608_18110 [Anaerolineaceae bacterium]|nr:hypothetical protein [Anaerolineaceae bacterium]
MISAYLNLVTRIHQELRELERVVARAERAIQAARERPEDQDLYIDSAALNLHDFYAGLERIFQQIGSTVDGHIPTGHNWHRELLQQMQSDLPDLRPPVLSTEVTNVLDEFLRFRHVLRNVYAFQFDPERIARLVNQLRPTWAKIQTELTTFASFLEQVGK